jgi:shikimate dehydrogenase
MSRARPERPQTTGGPRLSAATAVVGVIGDPVAHSLSPLLHNTAFAELGLDWVSVGFRVPTGLAAAALQGARAMGIRGLSVTMPHKEAVADLVDRKTPVAERLGAVNCVVFAGTGTGTGTGTGAEGGLGGCLGDNTDGPGLVAALRRGLHFEPRDRHCLVVGAGGAARAVVAALADAGAAEVVVVNRTAERGVAAAALAGVVGRTGVPADATGCDLVVNATPLGMAGTADQADQGGAWPIDPELVGPGHTVIDLVYHPALTPWLQAAQDRGAVVANGRGMLVHQAALQLATWTGLEPPVAAMWDALARLDEADERIR